MDNKDKGDNTVYTPSFRLNSVKNTRVALAKIINAYSKDKLTDGTKYRNLIYGLSYLLSAHRLEHEIIELKNWQQNDESKGRQNENDRLKQS